MTKASNRKRNFYRQQWRRDAAATIEAADPATIEAALARINASANAGILASSTARKDRSRLAWEVRRMHHADGLHPSDEEYDYLPRTGDSRKRDRENNEYDDDFSPDKQQRTGSPSGTVSTSLSTITADSDGVVGQIEDIGIKYQAWWDRQGMQPSQWQCLKMIFQGGFEEGRAEHNQAMQNKETEHNQAMQNKETEHNQAMQDKEVAMQAKQAEYERALQAKEVAMQAKQAEYERAMQAKETEHNQAMQAKEVAMQAKETEHNQAMQNKETEHNQAMQDKETEHNQAMQAKETEHNQAMQDKEVAMQAKQAEYQRAMMASNECVSSFEELILIYEKREDKWKKERKKDDEIKQQKKQKIMECREKYRTFSTQLM
jgi:hypothetical protein